MTIILIAAILYILAALLAWAFVRGGTRKPTPRLGWLDYDMRYRGGDEPCDICGEPSAYYLGQRCIHPRCREGSRVMTP